MERCSPTEMRKNLIAVDILRKTGIDFVCVPVTSAANKLKVVQQAQEAAAKLFEEAEKEECNG